MTGYERLKVYLDGWRTGNAEQSLNATAPGFFYEDPNTGKIERDEFLSFIEDFKSAVAEIRGGTIGTPFLRYTNTLISEERSLAWCWWQATGTDFQGAAVIQFGDRGVISEKIAYFTELP